jgi:hypothetical protein
MLVEKIHPQPDKSPEESQSPIALASLACFGSLAVVCIATKPFIEFLDIWKLQWLLYISIPIVVPFIILYRSSWHRELPGVTRTLSILLSACIIYVVVVIVGALALAITSVFFSGNMVSG